MFYRIKKTDKFVNLLPFTDSCACPGSRFANYRHTTRPQPDSQKKLQIFVMFLHGLMAPKSRALFLRIKLPSKHAGGRSQDYSRFRG